MKKFLVIFGMIICLCLSGCQLNKSDINDASKNSFNETEISIPKEVSVIIDIVVDKDENIKLISINESNDQVEMWEYVAENKKWASKYNLMQILNIVSSEQLETVSISRNGKVVCGIRNENGEREFIFINEKSEAKKLEQLSSLSEGELISNISYNSDDVLMAYNLPMGVSIVDEETDEIKQQYLKNKSAMVFAADQYENKLSIITSDGASTFDTDTQQEIDVDKNVQNFMSDLKEIRKNKNISCENISYKEFEGEECLYGISEAGIYRYQEGKPGVRLVNGNQTSIGNQNQFLAKVIVANDNKFYALMLDDNGSKLYKYEESGQKKETVSVFSIENSDVLQEAIATFNREHEDVAIELEVGVDGENDLTSSDIIRKLNTEILSDNGPDIILTDGMVLENYLDGDNFMDLSDLVDEIDKSEGVLENIANTYENEGKIYAIPTRFAIMAVSGSEKVVEKSANIEEMIAALEAEKGDIPTLSAWGIGHMATILYRSDLGLKYLKNSDLQKEEISGFYDTWERIYNLCDMTETVEGGKAIDKSFVDLEIYPTSYYEINDIVEKKQLAAIDYISTVDDYAEYASVSKEKVMFTAINKSQGNIYYPFSTIAVNNNTQKSEICKEFVKFFLSSEVQGKVRYGGIPVNLAAIDELKSQIIEDRKLSEKHIMSDQEWNNFDELLESLNMASEYDVTVMEIVLSNGEAFLRNEKTKDEAVDIVMKKLSIYQSE